MGLLLDVLKFMLKFLSILFNIRLNSLNFQDSQVCRDLFFV